MYQFFILRSLWGCYVVYDYNQVRMIEQPWERERLNENETLNDVSVEGNEKEWFRFSISVVSLFTMYILDGPGSGVPVPGNMLTV